MSKFHIDQPLDPNLITREEAAVIMRRSLGSVGNYIDAGRFTRYDLTGRCLFLDRREVEELATEINSGRVNVTRH
ncbi:hypothetical protein A0W34_22490 [Rhodococcus sp. BH4]|uniref:hypothetical protein n=1 Tax=Rhodococcus sp. BH4 TaxID=1807790 RepID=UPI0009C3AA73|nr:hypothetical protein [Rhodococcus sp. BH4]ARE35745.1 hypothetical protein A0W34_22490 [Rhodococcus sp. BH4]